MSGFEVVDFLPIIPVFTSHVIEKRGG